MTYVLLILSMFLIGCTAVPQQNDNFHECLEHHEGSRGASECQTPHPHPVIKW